MAVVVVAAVCDRGESVAGLHALLEHCDRTGAVFATVIKYTQTHAQDVQGFFGAFFLPPLYLCVDFMVAASVYKPQT